MLSFLGAAVVAVSLHRNRAPRHWGRAWAGRESPSEAGERETAGVCSCVGAVWARVRDVCVQCVSDMQMVS